MSDVLRNHDGAAFVPLQPLVSSAPTPLIQVRSQEECCLDKSLKMLQILECESVRRIVVCVSVLRILVCVSIVPMKSIVSVVLLLFVQLHIQMYGTRMLERTKAHQC